MSEPITFGTSGWRGVIGRDFTFRNVRLVVQAIANLMEKNGADGSGVVIGYDTRFLSEHFAREASKVFSHNKVHSFLCERDTPSPVLSFELLRRRAHGAGNFTASHHPPQYQGLRFSGADGAPALPQITEAVEKELRVLEKFLQFDGYYTELEYVELVDPHLDYIESISGLVDLEMIAGSGLSFAVDPMFGTSRDYLDHILLERGCEVTVIHNYRDPYLGGYLSGTKAGNLKELRQLVKEQSIDLGLATDVDADRFGIVDRGGIFVTANQILALLLDYLLETRKWKGEVARTVATSHLLDRVAAKHGCTVTETPVGFKYIGSLFNSHDIVFGGEESSGLTIHGHIPEKDGILACLLVAEMMAARGGKSLSSMLKSLHQEMGPLHSVRTHFNLTARLKERLVRKLRRPPRTFNGRKVARVVDLDGIKLLLDDGSWFLMRFSGTEPLVRCYGEASSRGELRTLMNWGREYIFKS